MSRLKNCKILSLILCFALLSFSLLNSFAVQNVATKDVPVAQTANSASELTPIYEKADGTGFYLGTQSTSPGNDFEFRNASNSNYSAVDKAIAAPSVTEVGEGYNGTAAMKVGYDKAYSRYLFRYRINDSVRTTTIKANEAFTIEMKVKLVSGSASGIYAGYYYAYDQIPAYVNDTQYTTKDNYDSDDLKASDWTTLTFTHTCPSAARWVFINITSSDENGCVLLIDDLKIYAAADETKPNLLTSDILIHHKNSSNQNVPYNSNASNVGSFDVFKGYDFDNSPYESTFGLEPIPNPGAREATVKPYISELGDGVKGGYALNIPVSSKLKNSVSFQGSNRSNKDLCLYWDTTYTVELKVRVKSGSLDSFKIGIFELWYGSDVEIPGVPNGEYIDDPGNKNYGKWVYDSYKNYGLSLSGGELSSEWQYYVFEVKTNKNNKNWKRLAIDVVAKSADTIVQIDDLRVSISGDTSGKYIAYQDNATYGIIPNNGTFEKFRTSAKVSKVDNTPIPDAKYQPIPFYDWTLAYDDKGAVITRADTTAVPRIYYNSNTNSRTATMPRISPLGEGVKCSYAMLIGNKDVPKIKNYEVGFFYQSIGAFVPETEYTFSVKLRKVGTVDRFKIGYKNLNGASTEYSLELIDEDFDKNGDWLEYTWKYTTNGETRVHYPVIFFAYDSATGGEVYVDDMTIKESLGIDTRNLFGWSTFDYRDLGRDSEKITFEPSFPEGQSGDFIVSKASNNKDATGNNVIARAESYADAISGNGVLAFGFNDEKECNTTLYNTLNATLPGKDYKISFWVKVQGEVDFARIAYGDSYQKKLYYNPGYSFNQYEQGKWTYVEFTVNDTGDYPSNAGYRRIIIEFKAPAGSGMLIDNLRVEDINYKGNPTNLSQYGTFERYDPNPNVVWSDKFITKKEGN